MSPSPNPQRDGQVSPSSSSGTVRSPSYQSRTPRRGSGDDSQSLRRNSTTSIASSIGGILETPSKDHDELNDLSQNAISTLLSHPIVRTGLVPQSAISVPSSHRPPSVRDIPPVTLTTIPHVDKSTFKPYLSRVGNLYETYQKSKHAGGETAFQQTGKEKEKQGTVSDYFSKSPQVSVPSTPLLVPSISSPQAHSPHLKRPSTPAGFSKRILQPTPLSTIPHVYFEENFHLENPRTFDVVSERSDVIPPDPQALRAGNKGANGVAKGPSHSGRRALHTNAILQEKLSWYMDTVEIHLISSIATASSSFFAALGSLKELQSEATQSIKKIKDVRKALQNLDDQMAVGGLELVKMKRRRENLRKLSSAVTQLCEVVDGASRCEELVDEGNFEIANNRLDRLRELMIGKSEKSDHNNAQRLDLSHLTALAGIEDGITQLRTRIGKGFETNFIDALLLDLRRHVDHVPSKDTLQRWANASFRTRGDHGRAQSVVPAYLNTNDSLRPDLTASLTGLCRANHTARAATSYREAVMREIKSLIRRHLPSSSDDDAESTTSMSTRGGRKLNQQEKSAILARNLRSLDTDSAEELLVKVYTAVGEALRRIGVQVKLILDVTSSLEVRPTPREIKSPTSPENTAGQMDQIREEVTQALDLSSLLLQATDVIQTQVTKVLKVRSEQNSKLPLQQFLRFFVLNRLFIDECEAVSSRGGEGLKDVVNSQTREFLQTTADLERQRIIQTLEVDKWEAKDFGTDESLALGRLLQAMDRTPPEWSQYTSLWRDQTPSQGPNRNDLQNGTETSHGATSTQKTRPATIDDQPYFVVQSTLSALYGIEKYLNITAAIPSLTNEAALKLVDYLKAFNSRCCQLILGAGATKSAGLKNITSKHLALASQACSFIIALIPYTREFIRKQGGSSANSIMVEFDKVKQLFQVHQTSIHEKLVDIMSQRSAAHIRAMQKIDWDLEASSSPNAVSSYMEALTKETGTLHRVLSRHLSDIDLQMIMKPIFAQYSQEWANAYREAVVKTEAGKVRMLADVKHLDNKFCKIEGSSELISNLLDIVKAKDVTEMSGSTAKPSNLSSDATESEPQQLTNNAVSDAEQVSQQLSTKPEMANDKALEVVTDDEVKKMAEEINQLRTEEVGSPNPTEGLVMAPDSGNGTAEAVAQVVAEGEERVERQGEGD